jgi:hypothetical protein
MLVRLLSPLAVAAKPFIQIVLMTDSGRGLAWRDIEWQHHQGHRQNDDGQVNAAANWSSRLIDAMLLIYQCPQTASVQQILYVSPPMQVQSTRQKVRETNLRPGIYDAEYKSLQTIVDPSIVIY